MTREAAEISANTLLTGAQIFHGPQATRKNTEAVMQIYNSIKSSYGPFGLDKMCVDASGGVSITNDGATILKNMLVDDPASRLIVNLALEQDKEVGDGTTSVVILAANLIKKGEELITEGVHPSIIVSGYRLAFNESMKYIKEHVSRKIKGDALNKTNGSSILDNTIVENIIRTAISSKIIYEEEELFIKIARDCISAVEEDGKYDIERISILKSVGGSMGESEFFNGYVLNCSIASPLMKREITEPKIACLDMSLMREKLPMTVNILVSDPNSLDQIRLEELEMTRRKCQAVIDSGATLVLCSGGIDELCIKMFIDNGIVAVKRVSKADLNGIAAAAGTVVKKSLVGASGSAGADMNVATVTDYCLDGLGSCKSFEIKPVGDYELCYLSGLPSAHPTVIIKGPNSQIVEEAERALNDAVQILKRTLESKTVLPGGGAVECALSFLLDDFSAKVNLKEHIAVYKYAEALLEIPKVLATNAGLDSANLVSEMLSKQFEAYESGSFDVFYGLDVVKGTVQDNFYNGILEPTMYKLKALKAATEAAIGVLRISEIVIFPAN